MDRLPHDPRNFREMVEADLRRAARLVIKVQDEIDPQLRVATPAGDWAIAVTLLRDNDERLAVFRALATFMVWKEALAFTFAFETYEPDAVWCCGIARAEQHICLARVRRQPRPWSNANFGPVEWLPEASIDPLIVGLLPNGPRPLAPKEVAAMAAWFGRCGKYPAINMATGEIGA
jgi:hypothetical protein